MTVGVMVDVMVDTDVTTRDRWRRFAYFVLALMCPFIRNSIELV